MHSMAAGSCATSMKYTSSSLVTTGTASVAHLAMVYYFVNVLDWGFDGVAIATSVHLFIRFVVSQIYLWTISELWEFDDVSFFSKETFENLGYQFGLGMMTMLMGIWGWWAFDIFTLICSYLAIEVISAQTVMRSLGLLTFMIPVGVTTASAILIGQNIGKGDIGAIRHYYRFCMLCAVFLGLAQTLLLIPTRDYLINVFTAEAAVVEQMKLAWTIFVVFVFFDTTQGVAMSCISASGLQKYGAIITACAYFVIGIPATLVAVFKFDFGIKGIWMGPTLATAFLTVTYMTIFSKIDWLTLTQKAKEQRAKDQ